MPHDEGQLSNIVHALRERAKELNCLYQVNDLLTANGERPLEEVLRQVIEILPNGWQYSEMCKARVLIENISIEPPGFRVTPWSLSATILVEGEPVGAVEVFYTRQMPHADEGPFLKEERRLIETVAERIASTLTQERLKTAHRDWLKTTGEIRNEKYEWRVVLDFLRETDAALLKRISRKLINHLSWRGVHEARELLQRGTIPGLLESIADENRPLRRMMKSAPDLTEDAFRIASEHLNESEILQLVTTWIKEDKSSFLVRALENQDTPLGEIIEALERYHHTSIEESELSLATQKGLRVSLIRRFFSENVDFINVAEEFIEVKDFYELLGSIIYPPRCHGKLGGKSAGLFLAKKIVDKSPRVSQNLRRIKVPKTWYVTSDWILHFVHHNDLEDVLSRKYSEIDQIRQEYPHLVALFKNSSFPSELAKGLAVALEDLGDKPLIVRSSSLLEDRSGSAFSGKYKSLFLGNRGTKEERLSALMDAIAEVYASIFGPDPTEYRIERGLLHVHEEMGIMIQEVVGQSIGRYFLPACSGVAFSNNEFRWSSRIQRGDGLIRLVPGLGTRAVDRVSDDYPVLIAPGQPNLRANVTVDEIEKYSPKRIDVINLESNAFETVSAFELLAECGSQYPQVRNLVSVIKGDWIQQPIGMPNFETDDVVFTFEGLIRNTSFVALLRELLTLLQARLRKPVDIEFAYDGQDFYLVQCRPESAGGDATPSAIPQNIPSDKVVFSASKFVSNGRVPDTTHIVYVDLDGYSQLEMSQMLEVGRAVSRLNKLLPKRQFIMIGPGRWGSRGDIKLGVPVTYSDINNTSMLIEVARQRGNYTPDLSFGTHFFQDLVEASIRYLPLYPDEGDAVFRESFLKRSRNLLPELLPEFASLSDTLHVIDVPGTTGGLILRVLMNADLDQAVGFLAEPSTGKNKQEFEFDTSGVVEKVSDEHWRWRFRMAQRIAAQLDPEKFGVKAFYLIGSTKNATAGPASDIDIMLHFTGSDAQREELLLWLDGWSSCLAEMNFLRTGYHTDGLLDIHLISDKDIDDRSSFAVKIDAITDAARKLPMRI
ncbi:MAG TPA: PEP/pyruvate-binding domain-containing protein [Terriglobales bacterium]|nr:PEP/pyruvate-binding domain-containing protein [Terriglobales bacterium]